MGAGGGAGLMPAQWQDGCATSCRAMLSASCQGVQGSRQARRKHTAGSHDGQSVYNAPAVAGEQHPAGEGNGRAPKGYARLKGRRGWSQEPRISRQVARKSALP